MSDTFLIIYDYANICCLKSVIAGHKMSPTTFKVHYFYITLLLVAYWTAIGFRTIVVMWESNACAYMLWTQFLSPLSVDENSLLVSNSYIHHSKHSSKVTISIIFFALFIRQYIRNREREGWWHAAKCGVRFQPGLLPKAYDYI